LDAEFPRKEEQYALTTIVTEAFLTGWHTRNEAIFKGKNKTEKRHSNSLSVSLKS
jgi:hypothetical protein